MDTFQASERGAVPLPGGWENRARTETNENRTTRQQKAANWALSYTSIPIANQFQKDKTSRAEVATTS